MPQLPTWGIEGGESIEDSWYTENDWEILAICYHVEAENYLVALDKMYDFNSHLPQVEHTIQDKESDTGTTPGRQHPVFTPIPQQGAMQSVSFIHPQLLNKRPLP